jgi:hypothetical protein
MKMTLIEKMAIAFLVLFVGAAFYFGLKFSLAVMRAEAQSSYIRD